MSSQTVVDAVAGFDTLPIAAWVLDFEGNVLAANQAAMRLGLEVHWQEIFPALVHFGTYIGDIGDLQLQAHVREHDGQRYVLALATDLSHMRRRLEDERRNATAERIESLGLVAGGIAHQLNNQLVSVIAEAGNLREDESIAGETKDALARVESAAQRVAKLTRQLLAYAGRGHFVTTLVDPEALIAEKQDRFAKRLPPGAKLSVELGAGSLAVQADHTLLRQVIRDVIENAGEALRGGKGTVTVRTRVLVEADRKWWQLEVQDDGIGMDTATQARIFDPFFSTKPERHGLGLAAALGIVRRLGGDICVESKPGKGSTFRVRLPVAADKAPPRRRTTAEQQPLQALSGLRILVADDEPNVRATVQRLLERRDAVCVLANDGAEAEQLLRTDKFDVVLLDVMMPQRTGYELVPIVRETQPAAALILMSGYSEQAHNVEPPDAFLEKPFNGATLEDTIRGALVGDLVEKSGRPKTNGP